MSEFSLYDIDQMYQKCLAEAYEHAEAHEGEIPGDLAQKLDGLGMVRDVKIENTLRACKNLYAEAAAYLDESDRLRKMQATAEARANWLKGYLAVIVGEGNKHKYSCGAISWRKSAAVEILNELAVPEKFKETRTEIHIDKRAIKEAIDNGEAVDGAKITERQSIQIK